MVLAVIPARKGSKGLPNKNLINFCGKPLLSWTVDAALESGVFDKIIVTTDYPQSALPSMNSITTYDKRPDKLCRDRVSLDKTLLYVANKYPSNIICLLQPTSPLREARHIKEAFEQYKKSGCDSLISVSPQHQFIWVDNMAKVKGMKQPVGLYNPERRPNRQKRKDWVAENGAIYFTITELLRRSGCRINGTVSLYHMDIGIEIDDSKDLAIAKAIYERH
jgi:CMP-N,N'-diacetyllegionaminic acid synthase